ncbi:MAG: tetratricopeptide repeat protein [Minwuia sp.]|uniref:tetratricopeptide repeat protein n=1 Tax=Minwuia sp. TaxID=2493630 RepID=UPI003A8805E5
MLKDRYDEALSTRSPEARDAYVEGVDRMLAGAADAEKFHRQAIEADPAFVLAHVALARAHQFLGDGRAARGAIEAARQAGGGMTAREASHLEAMAMLVSGDMPGAYAAIRAHLLDHPRDAVIAQTCCGVFGLIGFSGQHGREAEQLAFTTTLVPHYGDDWWFLGQHAFSQVEAGQTSLADRSIDRALEGNRASAHNVHIRAHVDYEAGGAEIGLKRLEDWIPGLDRTAIMHCHISWHIALWRLAAGDVEGMWQAYDEGVSPDGTWGPSINVITDAAALLYRAHLAGVDVPPDRWRRIAEYGSKTFPRTGIGFVDAHAALAFAMAGDTAELSRIVENARGPAGDLVKTLAEAFGDMATGRWAPAADRLVSVMAEHERLGGSRAQRDLVEFALAETLKQQDRAGEARRTILMRRPIHTPGAVIAGL